MRLSHLAATVLLATLLGCSASANLTATPGTSASIKPAASGAPSAAPTASPLPSTAPSATPTASPTPIASGSPSATCAAAFDRYNVDKDTTLSYDEYVAGKWSDLRFIKAPTAAEEKAHKDGFLADAKAADADKDQKLTRTEYATTCE